MTRGDNSQHAVELYKTAVVGSLMSVCPPLSLRPPLYVYRWSSIPLAVENGTLDGQGSAGHSRP